MNIEEFVKMHKVEASVKWAASNPHMPGFRGDHFKVTLKMSGRKMTVPFSQGYGISGNPTAADVLNCLVSDAWGADQSFEEWCGDLGYDSDSRKAGKTYRAVVRQTTQLKRFLGDLYSEALECEGL